MDQLRAQLGNYLDWLESRGLTGTVVFRAPSEEIAAPVIEAPPSDAIPAPPVRLGFFSSSELTEDEFIMVSKIALALGLQPEDFQIWADDSLVRVPSEVWSCSFLVALGPGSGQTLLAPGQEVMMNALQKAREGAPLLTIPHPRAMTREPALKAGAWTALQKIKALMSHV